jgi:hypothetical protein
MCSFADGDDPAPRDNVPPFASLAVSVPVPVSVTMRMPLISVTPPTPETNE